MNYLLPPDDRKLFFLLDRAAHGFRERIDALCRARLRVSAAQLVALFYVSTRDGARPNEVARALGTRPAAVTGLVDRMEAAGLLKRREHKGDGRAQELHVTAAGRRAIEAAKPVLAAANQFLADRFTAEELVVVARFLRTIGELDLAAFATGASPP